MYRHEPCNTCTYANKARQQGSRRRRSTQRTGLRDVKRRSRNLFTFLQLTPTPRLLQQYHDGANTSERRLGCVVCARKQGLVRGATGWMVVPVKASWRPWKWELEWRGSLWRVSNADERGMTFRPLCRSSGTWKGRRIILGAR